MNDCVLVVFFLGQFYTKERNLEMFPTSLLIFSVELPAHSGFLHQRDALVTETGHGASAVTVTEVTLEPLRLDS